MSTNYQKVIAILRTNGFESSKQVQTRHGNVLRRELSEGYRISVNRIKGRKIIGIECAHYTNHAEVTQQILTLLAANNIHACETKSGSAMIVIEA